MEPSEYVVLRRIDPLEQIPYGEDSQLSARPSATGSDFSVERETVESRGLAELQRDPQVVSVAPPMPVALVAPADEQDTEAGTDGAAWGVEVTGAVTSPFIGSGVTVAVIDSGIDAQHEAFEGVDIVEEDFTGEGNGDSSGHGTHVAGTIFGRAIEGYRFAVAPGVSRAVIGKIFGASGGGSTFQILDAIQWAIHSGAHVISMSLGLDFPKMVADMVSQGYPSDLATSRALEGYRANIRLFDSLTQLIHTRGLFAQGSLLVAAAGNESKRDLNPNYELSVTPPAAAERIISVGALRRGSDTNHGLIVPGFSNTGPIVAAPGVDIYSAKAGGGYKLRSGTSMATPHVAGVLALWGEKLLAEAGRIDVIELQGRLIGQASRGRLAASVDLATVGAGLVQAPQA